MNAELQLEPMRSKVVWGARIRPAVRLAAALLPLLLTSCSDAIREGQSPFFLTMVQLEGSPGISGTFGSPLQSDVLNVNPTTGAQSIAADNGRATLLLTPKDPQGAAPSPLNAITITQYRVEYIRSDGRNTPGLDVPFGFNGGVTSTIQGTGQVVFTLVRVQAKQEAPLQALAFSGGANTITTVARVTFFGRDQNGREVSVTGNIEVAFSDWAG